MTLPYDMGGFSEVFGISAVAIMGLYGVVGS